MKRRRYVGDIYSTGEVNAILDAVLHPLAKRDGRFFVVDTLLHALVEKDPYNSARKFMMYTLPSVMSQIDGTEAGMLSAGNRVLEEVIRLSRKVQGRGHRRRRSSKRGSRPQTSLRH